MSNYIIKDGELMHYGVPGMKWGRKQHRDHYKKYAEDRKKGKVGDVYVDLDGNSWKIHSGKESRQRRKLEKQVAKMEKRAKNGKSNVGKILGGVAAVTAVAAIAGTSIYMKGKKSASKVTKTAGFETFKYEKFKPETFKYETFQYEKFKPKTF